MGENWQDDAACRDMPQERFFPERGRWIEDKRAKAVCQTCPVRLPCLREGIDEQWGVWGGMSLGGRREVKALMASGMPFQMAALQVIRDTRVWEIPSTLPSAVLPSSGVVLPMKRPRNRQPVPVLEVSSA